MSQFHRICITSLLIQSTANGEHVQCAFETDFSNLINGTNQIGFAGENRYKWWKIYSHIVEMKDSYACTWCWFVCICVSNQCRLCTQVHNIRLKYNFKCAKRKCRLCEKKWTEGRKWKQQIIKTAHKHSSLYCYLNCVTSIYKYKW